MKKKFDFILILLFTFILINFIYLQIIFKNSTKDSIIIGVSIYFGLMNLIVLHFLFKKLKSEIDK